MSAPKGHLLLFCMLAGTVTILRFPSTPPSPKLSTGFAHSYPQAPHVIHKLYTGYTCGMVRLRMSYTSSHQWNMRNLWATSVNIGLLWASVGVHAGSLWAYLRALGIHRHDTSIVVAVSPMHTIVVNRYASVVIV